MPELPKSSTPTVAVQGFVSRNYTTASGKNDCLFQRYLSYLFETTEQAVLFIDSQYHHWDEVNLAIISKEDSPETPKPTRVRVRRNRVS